MGSGVVYDSADYRRIDPLAAGTLSRSGEHLSVNVLFDIPCSHSSSLMTSRLPDVCHG
jgi:hypothetical protein